MKFFSRLLTMKNTCVELSIYSEKLYRLFLDIIKVELDLMSISDISSIQALTLINVGKNTITIGELTAKGYYSGSNASYNLRKMSAAGYIIQKQSPHDKRACFIKLSDKGLKLYETLTNNLTKYTKEVKEGSVNYLEQSIGSIRKVLAIWSDILTNSI